MMPIDWQEIQLVVFDVDGTLYDQRCLRVRLARDLLLHCLRRPLDLRVLRHISAFRRCREQLALEEAEGILELQYRRPATALGIAPGSVERTVETWMLQRPLRHLRRCRYPSVDRVLAHLRTAGKTTAALSDYPAPAKLEALELEVDLCVSACDPEVGRLKPHPAGLLRVLELASAAPDESLLIGDRDDRDGECARRAGVHFLLKSARSAAPDGFADYAQLLPSLARAKVPRGAVQ